MKTIKEKFIAVAANSDGLQGKKDAEGEFLRACGLKVFPAGGIHVITASGKLLTQFGDSDRGLQAALQAWEKLPKEERLPGAVKVGELGRTDDSRVVSPPPGGLILKIYGRFMSRDPKGDLRYATLKDFPLLGKDTREDYLTEANPDYMWLTEAEWKALIPANPKKGDTFPLPPPISHRMLLLHMVPTQLYRQGGGWAVKDIRSSKVSLTVEEVSPANVGIRLEGMAQLRSDWNPKDYQAYEPRLSGYLSYDRQNKKITRFDMVALGDQHGRLIRSHFPGSSVEALKDWSHGAERPGRNPLAYAFELVSGDRPIDRLPPTGSLDKGIKGYFGAGK